MKALSALLLISAISFGATAQTTITNGGFESWGNTMPSGDSHTEPTNWYSNQSGSSIAALGGETCFKDNVVVHSGSYSVRVQTISGPLSTVINGNVTTGVVCAPSFTKTDGYIGTVNYSSASDVRRMSFTGKPDSLVGYYKYISAGSGEQGKVRAILHTGQYYDPETPSTYHPDPSANKVADVTFLTPASTDTSAWTRFSVPFVYADTTTTPAYIMINVTSSVNQATTVVGSTLWLDDLQVAYKTVHNAGITTKTANEKDAIVYANGNTVYVEFSVENEQPSGITLYDIAGRKVCSQQNITKQINSFQLPELKSGLYIYNLSNSNYSKTGKLFIQ